MANFWSMSWGLSTPTVTGSRHMSLPYSWEEVPAFNARMNQAIEHGCNWNGDVLYSELETVLHREASYVVAVYGFEP